MATSAPSSARARAMAAPMPREPPVTRATLPASFFDALDMRPTPVSELLSIRYICGTGPVASRGLYSNHYKGRKMADSKMQAHKPATIGRPRAFDRDQALDRALDVFWRKGYEGASICDLTEAMDINPPSLYAAFGNKEEVFRKALDRYVEMHDEFLREALA